MKKRWTRFKRALKRAPLSYYVAFCFTMVIVYTVVERVLTVLGYPAMEDSLTVAWMACWGGECLMCALIKLLKLKGEGDGLDN